jgi:hypothetical protein
VPPNGKSAVITNNAGAGNIIAYGDMNMNNTIIYANADTEAIIINATSVVLTQCNITCNPLLTPTIKSFIIVGLNGRINMFGSIITNTSTASNVAPLVSINNTTNCVSSSTISNSTLQYTSGASDAGTGLKCCIRFNNSASSNTYNLISNLFLNSGATSTTGTANQFLVVQKAQSGSVAINYYNNSGSGNYRYLPLAGSGLTKTALNTIS